MAWTVTLSALRNEVRNRGGYRRSTALTNAVMDGFINYGVKEVHELVIKHNPKLVVKPTSPDLTTVPGTATVALPTDFLKLFVKPLLVVGSSLLRLSEYDLDEEAFLQESADLWGEAKYRYMLQAGFLRLVPTPTVADTIRLWYLPHATKLVNDADVYDGVNGYEDLVIEYALKQAAERDRRPTADHDANIARLTASLMHAMESRDKSEPEYLFDHGRGWPVYG